MNRTVKATSRFSTRKLLFLALAFCVVALGSYKVGQWSVIRDNRLGGSPTRISEQESSSKAKESGDKIVSEPLVNSTDMPGKHSVG